MRKRRSKTSLSNQVCNLSIQGSNLASARLPSDYSPPIPKIIGGSDRVPSSISVEVHLTVRSLVELSRRTVSLVLENYLLRLITEGLDLEGYLLVEWMNSYLRGSRDPYELKEEKERQVIRLSDLLLQSVRNKDFTLGTKHSIDQEVTYWIRELLDPSGRKFASRRVHYQLEKFLCVRAVPVSSVYERDGSSVRYSSYCKGYGESSRMGRRQKTKPSFELDGKEPVSQGEISLRFIGIYSHLNLLEEKLRMKKT